MLTKAPAPAGYEAPKADFEITGNKSGATAKGRKSRGAKKSKLKISAIDESIEDTDWLIATPPPPSKRKKEQADEDKPEFGYKEPARKSAPDNPAQMSLW